MAEPVEEIPVETEQEAEASELKEEETPAPATPPPAPSDPPEVTPAALTPPRPKARGRPKGSTNRNTYQALAQRLDQMAVSYTHLTLPTTPYV